jgi:serine/threonine-protein kinase
MSAVSPGEVLAGKYRIERVLGEGGFGVVVAALHLQLRQRVALKFLLPHALRDPSIVERFVREARAMAGLRSQHVARVIDVGTLPDGAPYIVMELLEGEDLGEVVEKRGRLEVPAAAAAVLEACEAIGEAHALGIVHRDLKPSNLFRARGTGGHPIIKVLDFGISKLPPADEDHSLTRTHAVFGSPVYASPEQLRSTKHVDHRTDIWSLGVTLYHLVSGALPFAGATLSELAIKVAMDPMPRFDPALGIPPRFEAIVARCLEKEPAARYPTVAALAEDLAGFAVPTTLTGATGQAAAVEPGPARGRRRAALGFAAILGIGAAVAAAAVALESRGTPRPRPLDPPPAVVEELPSSAPQPDAAAQLAGRDAAAQLASRDAGAPLSVSPPRPKAPRPRAIETPELTYVELARKGDKLANQGDCKRAIPLFESAIEKEPTHPDLRVMLGYCLLAENEGSRAIAAFREALAQEPRRGDATFGMAEAYRLLGMRAEARAEYVRYLENLPGGQRADAARRRIADLDATK